MKNVALLGLSGAGKTSVAEILQQIGNFQICKTGHICRQISQVLYGNDDRNNLNLITDALKTISQDILISAALRSLDSNRPVVLDAIRYQTDYDFAQRKGYILLRISTDPSICIDRLRQRGQLFDSIIDLEHPSEIELTNHPAHYEIRNNGTLESLTAAVNEAFSKL